MQTDFYDPSVLFSGLFKIQRISPVWFISKDSRLSLLDLSFRLFRIVQ